MGSPEVGGNTSPHFWVPTEKNLTEKNEGNPEVTQRLAGEFGESHSSWATISGLGWLPPEYHKNAHIARRRTARFFNTTNTSNFTNSTDYVRANRTAYTRSRRNPLSGLSAGKMPRMYGRKYGYRRSRAIRGKGPSSRFRRSTMMPRTALQYQVRRTLNRLVEWKNKRHQITWSDLTPQAGQITDITQVAQGQTDSTRIGDSLNAASIQLRGRVNYGTVGSGEGIFRLIVFQWFDTSTPVASEILNPGTVVGETTTDMYNTDMGNRFKIYMDKSYDVSANGGNPHYRQLINRNRS